MAKENNPVITMTGYRITEIHYRHFLDKEEFESTRGEDKDSNVKMAPEVSSDPTRGRVQMTTHIVLEKIQQIGDVTIVGFFKFRDDINDEAEQYRYLSVNGAAMIYPYLRVTVSMLTALDRPDTTLLPTLNFVEMFDKVEKDEHESESQDSEDDRDNG